MNLRWLVILSLCLICFYGNAQPIPPQECDFKCVDIYKQPAFQHPNMKDHKIQVKPSTDVIKTLAEDAANELNQTIFDQLKILCPENMVPIQRPKAENQSYHVMAPDFPGQHFAALKTVENDENIYRGASESMSIHALHVVNNQYTHAHIWLEYGPRSERNSLQFGWAVHRRIYRDTRTRLTTYWTDKYSGHWLLMYGDQKIIGYWPREIFTHLIGGATFVRYGGNLFESPDGVSPPMGDGRFPGLPSLDYRRSAFSAQCKYVTNAYQNVDMSDAVMLVASDVSYCYKVQFWRKKIPESGQMFTYGGPGGQCGS